MGLPLSLAFGRAGAKGAFSKGGRIVQEVWERGNTTSGQNMDRTLPILRSAVRMDRSENRQISGRPRLIARYTRPVMGRIWSDENKFRTWLKVEIAATETLAAAGIV